MLERIDSTVNRSRSGDYAGPATGTQLAVLLLICVCPLAAAHAGASSSVSSDCKPPRSMQQADVTLTDERWIASRQTSLSVLLDRDDLRPLQQHHECQIEQSAFAEIALDLLSLTRGSDFQLTQRAFLSRRERFGEEEHYLNARSLGMWLGSLKQTLSEHDLNNRESAQWLVSLASSLDAFTESSDDPAGDMQALAEPLIADVKRGYITLHEAIKLLAYGDVIASSVTMVISQAMVEAQDGLR